MIVRGVQRHCHVLKLSTVGIQALEKQVQQAGDMQQQLQLLQAESQQLTITEHELEVAEDRVCTYAEHCLLYIASMDELLQGCKTMTLLVMLTFVRCSLHPVTSWYGMHSFMTPSLPVLCCPRILMLEMYCL